MKLKKEEFLKMLEEILKIDNVTKNHKFSSQKLYGTLYTNYANLKYNFITMLYYNK